MQPDAFVAEVREEMALIRQQTMNNVDIQLNAYLDKLGQMYDGSSRRSSRTPGMLLQAQEQERIEEALQLYQEDGIEIVPSPGKGRGIHTTRRFHKNEFIVEYRGDVISSKEAAERLVVYNRDPSVGCYMMDFKFDSRKYSIDATRESPFKGRLLNHSFINPNVISKLFVDKHGNPHIIFVANRDVERGEEILYDYGEKSKAVLLDHPWLRSS